MKYSVISFVLAASVLMTAAIKAPAVRAESSEPHVLIAQVWMGNSWGTILSQEFTSRERCEAAALY